MLVRILVETRGNFEWVNVLWVMIPSRSPMLPSFAIAKCALLGLARSIVGHPRKLRAQYLIQTDCAQFSLRFFPFLKSFSQLQTRTTVVLLRNCHFPTYRFLDSCRATNSMKY